MDDRYVYAVAVEAFFLRAMEGRLDDGTRARVRQAGIVLDEPLLSVYPAAVFHRCVAIAAETAYPGVSPAEAQFHAGKAHIDGFIQSYPGKMMAALARQLDARTILDYTATFLRLGNNYTETRARVLGPNRVEVWVSDVGGVPGWYQGVIQRGLEVADVKGVTVGIVPDVPSPAAAYDAAWTGR